MDGGTLGLTQQQAEQEYRVQILQMQVLLLRILNQSMLDIIGTVAEIDGINERGQPLWRLPLLFANILLNLFIFFFPCKILFIKSAGVELGAASAAV